MLIQVYESDFGGIAVRGSAKLRRMTRRRLKKHLAFQLRKVLDNAAVSLAPKIVLDRQWGMG
jgi:hypothetical protein